jgi:hypothetical protein
VWPPQRKCMTYATMSKRMSRGHWLQKNQWILQPPLMILHPSPHGNYHHWLPSIMVCQQLTNCGASSDQWWSFECHPLTHQWSLQWPKHHHVGPLPSRLTCIIIATSDCMLLPWNTARTSLQSSIVGKENHWSSVDHISKAMPQPRIIWQRLQRAANNHHPLNDTQQTASDLRSS